MKDLNWVFHCTSLLCYLQILVSKDKSYFRENVLIAFSWMNCRVFCFSHGKNCKFCLNRRWVIWLNLALCLLLFDTEFVLYYSIAIYLTKVPSLFSQPKGMCYCSCGFRILMASSWFVLVASIVNCFRSLILWHCRDNGREEAEKWEQAERHNVWRINSVK